MPYFGQEIFLQAEAAGPLTDAAYVTARDRARQGARAAIDHALRDLQLDAIIAPTEGPAWLTDLAKGDSSTGYSSSTGPAVAGYPHITVPMGEVGGLPVGLSFMGTAWSEGALIRLAYAYEQAR
jgi:amidase